MSVKKKKLFPRIKTKVIRYETGKSCANKMENSYLVADVPETNGVLDPLAPRLQSVEKQSFVKKV